MGIDDVIPRFLSWGCGLQSTVIGEMSACGDLPKCTIIHADTGWERQVTIEMRDWYTNRWQKMGLEVHIIAGQDIKLNATERRKHMPFRVDGGAPIGRGCTREFKIVPIKRLVRQLLGFDATKPPHPRPGSAIIWLGITVDEWTRAKPSRIKFMGNRFPLLVARMDRRDCALWLGERGLPVPPKSACVGCPHRRASEWLAMRNSSPDEWKDAIEFDERIRDAVIPKIDADELFIYRHAEPLADADLEADAARERQRYGTQLPIFACESGFCGI